MSHPSLNLTARDFDAYAAEKATSNAFSRPRLEVKQRALAWARGVVTRLAELGMSVDVHGSDEHPSLRNKKRVDAQWVFFWRDQAARDELDRLLDRGRSIASVIDDPSPYTRHAFLAFRLDTHSVEVCFAVHPEATVDVDNLRARLADGEGALAAELIGALTALPEQFTIGVVSNDRVAASAATPEAIATMIEHAAAGQVPLWIGWSVTRETAIAHADILDDQLQDALVALAPIYRLVAWSRENDRLALDRRMESVEQERARAHAVASAETERWRVEQEEARRRSAEQARARAEEARRTAPLLGGARRPSLDTLFSGPARAPNAHRDASEPASPLRGSAAQRPPTPPPAKEPPPEVEVRAVARAEDKPPAPVTVVGPPPIEPIEPIAKGTKVRVLSGPFADKIGVVGELDSRGGARILLGLLSTRLDLTDLEALAEERERPSLQTSHRRPVPPSPRKTR